MEKWINRYLRCICFIQIIQDQFVILSYFLLFRCRDSRTRELQGLWIVDGSIPHTNRKCQNAITGPCKQNEKGIKQLLTYRQRETAKRQGRRIKSTSFVLVIPPRSRNSTINWNIISRFQFSTPSSAAPIIGEEDVDEAIVDLLVDRTIECCCIFIQFLVLLQKMATLESVMLFCVLHNSCSALFCIHVCWKKKKQEWRDTHTLKKKIRCIRIWKLLVDWDDTVATSQMEMTLFRKPSLLLCKSTSWRRTDPSTPQTKRNTII